MSILLKPDDPHLPVAITKADFRDLGSALSWVVPEASGLAAALL